MKRILMIMVGLALCLGLGACGKSDDAAKVTKITIKANDVYTKPARATNYQAKLYNKLTAALKAGDEAKTATLVAENFAAQFFNLQNRKSASDIGGLTYIVPNDQESFSDYAMNYVYANYKTIKDKYGSDSLPAVKSIKVKSSDTKQITYPVYTPANATTGAAARSVDTDFNAYVIKLKITYASTDVDEADLKVNTTIYVINLDNRLSVAIVE